MRVWLALVLMASIVACSGYDAQYEKEEQARQRSDELHRELDRE